MASKGKKIFYVKEKEDDEEGKIGGTRCRIPRRIPRSGTSLLGERSKEEGKKVLRFHIQGHRRLNSKWATNLLKKKREKRGGNADKGGNGMKKQTNLRIAGGVNG